MSCELAGRTPTYDSVGDRPTTSFLALAVLLDTMWSEPVVEGIGFDVEASKVMFAAGAGAAG